MAVILTPEKVASWGACYTIERLRELGEPSITVEGILQLDIPLKDKAWIVGQVLNDPDFVLTREERIVLLDKYTELNSLDNAER